MVGFPPVPGPCSNHQLLRKERFFASDLSCMRTTLGKVLQHLLLLLPSLELSPGAPAFPPRVVRGVLPLLQSLLPDVTLEMAALLTILRGVSSSSSSAVINFPVAWTARTHSPVPWSPGGGGGQATLTVRTRGCWPGEIRSRIVRWGRCSFPGGSCPRGPGTSGAWASGTGSRWAPCSG